VIGTQNFANLQGQGFQPPQRPQRLGFVVQFVLQGLGDGGQADVGKVWDKGLHGEGLENV
jgi:hypothetical protein